MNENEAKIDALERQSEIESKKLGVAEDLGWIIGLLSATIVHMKWGEWIYSVITPFIVFYFVTYFYREKDDKARDSYHRVAGIAKYRSSSSEH